MILPFDYTHIGYNFGDKVPGLKIHTGADLNWGASAGADLGRPVKAIAYGVVVYSREAGAGWGNMMVVWHKAYGIWSRYAHLDKRWYDEGQVVKEGQEIGACGKTGTTSPHLHFDIIRKELPKWTNYTYKWSEAKLREYYLDPLKYIEGIKKAEMSNQPQKTLRPAVDWAIESKITNGDRPQDPATREEIMQMLLNYHNRFYKK